MKVEKQADGSEVWVFEKMPWEEDRPCWDCKKRKEPPEEYIEAECRGRVSILLGKLLEWFAYRSADRVFRKTKKRCGGCEKLKKWQERQDYWASRTMEVAASMPATSSKNILYAGLVEEIKRGAEDDKGSKREINGEADEERDKEADAED